METLKRFLKKNLPVSAITFIKFVRNNDMGSFVSFLRNKSLGIPFSRKLTILKRFYSINNHVDSPHKQKEILEFVTNILQLPTSVQGKIAEAGCFKGGSTSKISIAAKKAGREFMVFDSFEGIPDNEEQHERNIFGGKASFKKGDYCGTLQEVKSNVQKFGEIDACSFHKGWFEDTLPHVNETLAAVYIDADLASSTKTCLKYFYPLLSSGGILFSHDGHLPLVLDVYNDDKFWEEEVGYKKPVIQGFNKNKLIKIVKP